MAVNVNRNGKITQQLGTWSSSNTYWAGDPVIYNGTVYITNSDVAAGTATTPNTSGSSWSPFLLDGRPAGSVAQLAWGGQGTLLFRTTKGKVYGSIAHADIGNCGPGAGRVNNTSYGHRSSFGFMGVSELFFYETSTTIPTGSAAPYEETGKCIWVGMQDITGYALFDSGNLWVWGDNRYGQLGIGSTTAQGVPRLTAKNVAEVYIHKSSIGRNYIGYTRSIYRSSTNGKIYACGYNGHSELGFTSSDANTSWVELTWAGTYPFSVWNCGNVIGATIVNKNMNATPSEANRSAGTGPGKIIAVGFNTYGQLGNGTSGGNTTDGTATNADVSQAWTGVVGTTNTWRITDLCYGAGEYLNADYNDSFAMMWLTDSTNGQKQIRTCGGNGQNQIGDTTNTQRNSPVQLTIGGSANPDVKQIAIVGGGRNTACFVLLNSGALYTWGYNGYGVLGMGDTTNRTSPTTSASLSNIKEILFASESTRYNEAYTNLVVRKNSSDATYPNAYMVTGQANNGVAGTGTTGNGPYTSLTEMRLPRTLEWAFAARVFTDLAERSNPLIIDTAGNWWSWGPGNGYVFSATSITNRNVFSPVLVTPTIF